VDLFWPALQKRISASGHLPIITWGTSCRHRRQKESTRSFFNLLNLRELEVYCDLGLNFDGLIAEVVGFVFPLLDRIDGGAR
jgi:hypothetical protein